jgi:hypothetical protein
MSWSFQILISVYTINYVRKYVKAVINFFIKLYILFNEIKASAIENMNLKFHLNRGTLEALGVIINEI